VNEFYEFLMHDLNLVSEEFETDSECAHEICKLLSVDDFPIPETFFRMYTASVDIDYVAFYNAASFFSGAGLLSIDCDCPESDKYLCDIAGILDSAFFEKGRSEKTLETDVYSSICDHIDDLRKDILT